MAGISLLAAAILKASSFRTDVPNGGLVALLVGAEVGLGSWVLSGWKRIMALRVALTVFLMFAIVSGFRFRAGAATCGCLGEVSVPPIAMFLFDMLMVVAIGSAIGIARRKSWRLRAIGFSVLAGLACLPFWGPWLWSWDHGPPIRAPHLDLGELTHGVVVQRSVWIRNPTSHDIEVWSTDASCHCACWECATPAIPARGACRASVTIDLMNRPDGDGNLRVELRGYDRTGQLSVLQPVRATIGRASKRTRVAVTQSGSRLNKE
jgi:hypothetical protein